MTKHDNWRNYETAVSDATADVRALGVLLDTSDVYMVPELVAPAARAEYALCDALSALQEAQTWHQARSALLFWEQRWAIAVDFVSTAIHYVERLHREDAQREWAVARELEMTNQTLMFALAELNARLTAFREIRPQSAGAASRVAYLEHKHR